MNPNTTPPPDDETESRDSVLVEFSDADHPWEPVPRDELDDILRRHPSHKPNDSPDAPAN